MPHIAASCCPPHMARAPAAKPPSALDLLAASSAMIPTTFPGLKPRSLQANDQDLDPDKTLSVTVRPV